MKKKTSTELIDKYLPKILADIEMLTREVEAHRLTIAWLLEQLPGNEGHEFLSRQANHFKASGNSDFRIVIDELDAIKSLFSSPAAGEPSQ